MHLKLFSSNTIDIPLVVIIFYQISQIKINYTRKEKEKKLQTEFMKNKLLVLKRMCICVNGAIYEEREEGVGKMQGQKADFLVRYYLFVNNVILYIIFFFYLFLISGNTFIIIQSICIGGSFNWASVRSYDRHPFFKWKEENSLQVWGDVFLTPNSLSPQPRHMMRENLDSLLFVG